MKINLVFPPFYFDALYNLAPTGLVNIATMLKNEKYKVNIYDFVLDIRLGNLQMNQNIYDECTDRLLKNLPDIVAFSAQCTTYPAIIQISNRIKQKNQDIKIIIGGHNIISIEKETLENFSSIDAIVRGEGEITFKELVETYDCGKDLSQIKGITFRDGDIICSTPDRDLISNLDDLPFTDYSLLPHSLSEYRDACGQMNNTVILEIGRGCPHNCVYCSESKMWQQKSRTHSVDRIIKDMHYLHSNFNADYFLLAYDQFTANKKFVKNFCESVIDSGLNHIPWYSISRLDTVDAKLLKLMKKAGCASMCYGIDSGSEKTLKFINKKIDKNTLFDRVKNTTDQKILPTLSFIVGFPEEEKNDIEETLILALQSNIQGVISPLIQMPTTLAGTDLHKNYSDKLIRKFDTYFAYGLEFDNKKRLAEDESLINSFPKIFSCFYNLPSKNLNIEDIKIIADFFNIIVTSFPRTFMCLKYYTKKYVYDLFLQFIKFVNEQESRTQWQFFTVDSCKYIIQFVEKLLLEDSILINIKEIIRYELSCAEAFWHTSCSYCGVTSDNYLAEGYFRQNTKVVIFCYFKFNIFDMIEDLKKDLIKKQYHSKSILIGFIVQQGSIKTNVFSVLDYMIYNNCNGINSVLDIIKACNELSGKQIDEKEFYCTLEKLKNEGFIKDK
ncbi:radical SAM domain-containing protein [Candidatus Magnetomorum sp. HK-1]|nr:radical SAM domain-containing protein [Candidatus Magnetomorum sp. HK-1]